MAIVVNDNFQNNSPKSLDNKYLSFGMNNYASVSAVNTAINPAYRHLGLTVKIGADEYWYRNGLADTDLILKSSGEVNTASNVGSGIGVYKDKVGVNFNFKSFLVTAPITINTTANEVLLDMTVASASSNGYLTSANWSDFNSKTPSNRTLTGVNSISGGGDLTANRTFQFVNDSASPGNSMLYGTNGSGVKGWYTQFGYSGAAPINVTGGVISVNTATTAQTGVLTAADWNTFNNKVPTTRTITGTLSVTGGGDLSANRTLSLVNDAATPGANYYYGTNGSGTKGYFLLPAGGTGEANVAANVGTGVGAYKDKTSVTLNFKSFIATSPLNVTANVNDLTFAMTQATSGSNGWLSSTDWNTFNNKVPTTRSVSTTGSLQGGGDLSANRTLSLVNDNAAPGNNYYYGTNSSGTKGFYVLSASGETNTGSNLGTGVAIFKQKTGVNFEFRTLTSTAPIVITYNGTDYANIAINQGGASGNGYITSTDWNTFNGKVSPTRAVNTTNSLTGGGNLSADRTLQLVNDVASPGSTYYYGTDSSGTKGYYPLPVLSAGSEFTIQGFQTFTYTETSAAGQLALVTMPPYTVWKIIATYLVYDVNSDQVSTYEVHCMTKSSFSGTTPSIYNITTNYSAVSGSPYGAATPNISSSIDTILLRVIPGQVNTTKAGQKIIKVIANIKQLNTANP